MVDSKIGKLVMIASSTGGPKALYELVPTISKNIDAPVVIVQHMPKGFTTTLAARLNELSEVTVSEVVDGEVLEKGHVYLAAGGKHLELEQGGSGRLIFRENQKEPVGGLRPCANITFKSLLSVSVRSVVCVVLTGMGMDGCEGITELRKVHDVYTIAQNKETCVVYGMPKAVVENGIADTVLPLKEIGREIMRKVGVH